MSRIPRSNQSINHSKISLFLSLSRAPIGFNRRAVKNRTLPFSAFICPQISLSRAPLIILSLFTIVVTANRIKKGESLALCVKTLHLPTIVCCSAATLALCLVIFFSYRDTVRERSCHYSYDTPLKNLILFTHYVILLHFPSGCLFFPCHIVSFEFYHCLFLSKLGLFCRKILNFFWVLQCGATGL